MAVVVQQMVQCDVAGVGFSLNPVNGDLNELIVDANFGLGESVVSGEGLVDHFVLDRALARSAPQMWRRRPAKWLRLPVARKRFGSPRTQAVSLA